MVAFARRAPGGFGCRCGWRWFGWLPTFIMFKHLDEAIQALFPKDAVLRQPVVGHAQTRRVQSADAPLGVDLAFYQAGVFQYTQVA